MPLGFHIDDSSQKTSFSFGFDSTNNSKAQTNQEQQNDWDRQHAQRYGANAPIWTVAAGYAS